MRTTIDLPADLHAVAREMAHQQHKTLSQVIAGLVRLGLGPISADASAAAKSGSAGSGLPTIWIGRPVTAEDVWALEDE